MKMRDYAILASVAHGPKSGYDLARWFERVASHFCTAGYSSVYPALARFEEEGLVAYEATPSSRGPERKVYSITAKGREALLEWVAEPAAAPRTQDEQLVKALGYGMLPEETTQSLLEQTRGLHSEKLEYYQEREQKLEEAWQEGGICKEAYIGTKLVLRRGISAEESYVRWCEEAKSLLASQ